MRLSSRYIRYGVRFTDSETGAGVAKAFRGVRLRGAGVVAMERRDVGGTRFVCYRRVTWF